MAIVAIDKGGIGFCEIAESQVKAFAGGARIRGGRLDAYCEDL